MPYTGTRRFANPVIGGPTRYIFDLSSATGPFTSSAPIKQRIFYMLNH
jgi:hypothetical protein